MQNSCLRTFLDVVLRQYNHCLLKKSDSTSYSSTKKAVCEEHQGRARCSGVPVRNQTNEQQAEMRHARREALRRTRGADGSDIQRRSASLRDCIPSVQWRSSQFPIKNTVMCSLLSQAAAALALEATSVAPLLPTEKRHQAAACSSTDERFWDSSSTISKWKITANKI